ncbi:MAG: hypothetical protein HQK50_12690 [Oligoflexia bacterium]|nr:hypothetical protein [Oligoflexia bacterium]
MKDSSANVQKEQKEQKEQKTKRQLIQKCHLCGAIIETYVELSECPTCKKHFFPLNYWDKATCVSTKEMYMKLFSTSDELSEEDLIKGIHVLW